MAFTSKWFKPSEFQCKCEDPGCTALREPKQLLLQQLDQMRNTFGNPIVITSGLRCAVYNARVGGVADSAHVIGEAADVATETSTDRYSLLRIGLGLFNRLGIGKNFVHVDVSSSLAQHVCWTYYP